MFDQEHLQKIEEGVHLFNEQKYWECHEVLEDLWMEDRNDPVRYVYWAIIQVAAVCIHYRDKNIAGARGMVFKAKEKFQKCRELHILSNLTFRHLDWEELERLITSVPDGEKSELEDFKALFDFRFKHF